MAGKRKLGGWLFLGLAFLAQVATALIEPALAYQALAAFVAMLQAVASMLALVFVLMFLAERYLDPRRTRVWLGQGSGPRGWMLAVLAGVISTGPVYAWYGLLADLRAKGMRTALVAVVLYARAIKLPLLPLLAHYFGLGYMLVLSLLIAGFAILNGLVMERLARPPKTQ